MNLYWITSICKISIKIKKSIRFHSKCDLYFRCFLLWSDFFLFIMQIYLLNKRFRQHQQIIWQNRGGVQDRTIYEVEMPLSPSVSFLFNLHFQDAIFAKMLKDSKKMSERDYRTYIELFQNMSNFMRKPKYLLAIFSLFFSFSSIVSLSPSLIVHLDVSPEESLNRIRMRCRLTNTSLNFFFTLLFWYLETEGANQASQWNTCKHCTMDMKNS